MSFLRAIFSVLRAHPSRTVLVEGHGASRRTTTAGALLARIATCRLGLREQGVGPGDRVALVAGNSAEWIACDLAVLAEGGVLVPLDPRQGPDELLSLIADSDPELVVLGDTADVDPGAGKQIALASLAGGPPATWSAPRSVPGDSLATIIYTSGSSGEPKGAMLTRNNMTFMLRRTARRLREVTGWTEAGFDRTLHYLPLCYAGSRILLHSCLLRGARLELIADPRKLGESLPGAEPDYFLNVPLVLDRFKRAATAAIEAKGATTTRLLREAHAAWDRTEEGRSTARDRLVLALAKRVLFAPIRARFGDRLRGVICGSAPLDVDTQRFFRMVGLEVYQGYGLTETTALCTLDLSEAIRPGWVGPTLPGVEMRRSPDGEILSRGPHIFAGYWDRPEETAEAFTEDGWFRTGDLGDVDALGRWRVTGRRSAVLVLQTGHNVAPEPLEEALQKELREIDPGLTDAQVVLLGHGRPHLAALITSPPMGTPGDRPLPRQAVEQALARLNPTLQRHKRIHAFRILREPFATENGLLTANLKLRRKAIAARYFDEVDSLYASPEVATVGAG